MKTYSLMVFYDGFGSVDLYLPRKGNVKLFDNKPLFIKNAAIDVVEALREYRPLKVRFKITNKVDGAFKVIDYASISPVQGLRSQMQIVSSPEPLSNGDISNILKKGSNGPISENGNSSISQSTTPVSISQQGETGENNNDNINYADYIVTTGRYEGKTLKEIDEMGKLKAIYNGVKLKPEHPTKIAIENYYKQKIK